MHYRKSPVINIDRIKSVTPINVDSINISISTTPVEPTSSSRVGQVTFCISVRTSEKKFLTF